MNRIQRIRQALAENGTEKTHEEVRAMYKAFKELWRSLDYELYMHYKALSDDDIREMAKDCGDSYEMARDAVDITLYLGDLKFG